MSGLQSEPAKQLSLYEQIALKRKAREESTTKDWALEVGLEMERTTAEKWLARLLKKPIDALTDVERAFVIHLIWEIISRDRWSLLGSGKAPLVDGFEALNLHARAILVTRHIGPIIGPKTGIILEDAPAVLPGEDEKHASRYLASQGLLESEYWFKVNVVG